jgi:hypothetical protein
VIVRHAGSRLLLITQPDHAQLSRGLMDWCAALRTHPRRAPILHAIGEHDNGWTEPDAAPTVDPGTGRPFDFVSAPAPVRQAVWPRGVGRLASDPWAAALVAQHAITVYDRYRGDAAWATFFADMERLRDRMVGNSGGSPGDLAADYVFVRLGDLLSLAFCTGWSETLRMGGWSVACSGTHVRVSPDPFAGAVVPIEIAARDLPAGPYRDDGGLRAEFARAPLTVLRGDAAGS